ncbi:MAG TPA: secondary thiamine-phosphate synthase enzyme YjbQ [Aggregatilineales bacterium]|nr:YjbQ family protein [Chloroflexota bacterium]HOA23831.1 secondary thiamine-phosphate synthase enzyme YjbQ [Aggregatilineales bacterium]HPV05541.1 secondary thiamine-phosphate synthase enzyme YjbQ [Aggregatilineales bacterium]HQA66819.1 secondary thiamine-phosphate synthase enzyme YjbQ [Aggregatilineales bacterium]HQE17433.1 secondary thiamine-phosphate synthase enzyme YjbQ [Aggregatilineales bacterium]
MQRIHVHTQSKKQVLDITDRLNRAIADAGATEGVCHVFVAHSTAALSTAVLDPGTDLDMLDAYTLMLPDIDYRHPHDPTHAPDHILATLIGPSVSVPFSDGRLILGTWQRVVLFEFDGPRDRELIVTLCG